MLAARLFYQPCRICTKRVRPSHRLKLLASRPQTITLTKSPPLRLTRLDMWEQSGQTHMFSQLNPANARRQRWFRLASLAAHGLVLAGLLHSPTPKLLTAASVALGQNGTSVTRLYWSSKTPDNSS